MAARDFLILFQNSSPNKPLLSPFSTISVNTTPMFLDAQGKP